MLFQIQLLWPITCDPRHISIILQRLQRQTDKDTVGRSRFKHFQLLLPLARNEMVAGVKNDRRF